MRRSAWLIPLILLALSGCAAPLSSRDSDAPRVRCLYEPTPGSREVRDRPLIFFLCIEAP